MDQEHIVFEESWNLPTPNAEAAYISLAKYAKPFVNMSVSNIGKMNLAYTWMAQHFGVYMGNSDVIDLTEAMAHVDKSTSSGSPFNKEFATKGELFEQDTEISDWLEKDWDRLGEDPNWTTIFTSSLKEELRPIEKIAQNSIRTFTAGAVDVTVHGTRLFVDQNEKMYASHLKTASVIGMSPLKGNWDQLYQKLNVFPNGYALDESQYDSSIREFLMWGCAKFRYECLKPKYQTAQNLRRIQTYYRNLVHTVILSPDGVLVMKKSGQPSGSVNTVSDNTLILYWILAYAWIFTAPEEYCSLAAFEDHTSKALLGDDNTWSVSNVAHQWFNAVNVIDVWKTLGITTTTDSLKPRPVCDLDFLSAHTVFLRGRAVPLYDRNKLMQSLVYAKTAHLTPVITLTRVCCLLQIGWTDIPFREYCKSLIDFLLERYDHILANDKEWIIAKTNIKTDEFYARLILGDLQLAPQSYGEPEERFNKPHKAEIMNSALRTNQPKRTTRRVRRVRGPKKGKATVKKLNGNGNAVRRRNRVRRGGLRPQATRYGALSAFGGTSFNGSGRSRSCIVEEDEFIGAITSGTDGPPTTFAVTSYPLNPGQVSVFPWLSKQAAQWEKYTFEMLEFYYKREVSEFATAGTTGKIIFSGDYDASDPPPSSKQQMEDTVPHVDCMPSENLKIAFNKALMHPSGVSKYVRPAGLPGSADIKTYDAGILNVATQGIAASTTELGELRVRYRVRFEVPILESSATAPRNNSVAVFSNTPQALTTGNDSVLLLNAELTNGINVVNNAGSFVFPAGNYLVDFVAQFVSTGAMTEALVNVKKDGVAVTSYNRINFLAAAGCSSIPVLSDPMFLTSDGTNVYQFIVNSTFTATNQAEGNLRIVAI